MAEIITSEIDEQPVTKSRADAWGELASQQYATPTDLPTRTTKPGSGFDTVEKVGVFNALVKGLPSNKDSSYGVKQPLYQPTIPEALASTLTDFARSGTAVLAEFTPEMRDARKALEELRKSSPEAADQIESASVGKKLSNKQLLIKGGAALAEGALTLAPMFKVGRAVVGAAELATLGKTGRALKLAEEAATLSKAGAATTEITAKLAAAEEAKLGLSGAGKAFVESSTLQNLYKGGLGGAVYGGLYGLHAYDADFKEAAKGALIGGASGAALVGAGSALAFLGKYGGNKVIQGLNATAPLFKAIDDKIIETIPAKWYSGVFSVESTMKKYYGDIGENFINMYKKASKLATMDLGRIQIGLIDAGLLEPPTGMGKAFKNVAYIGDDAERMTYYNKVLRGQGAYANKEAQTAAIQADKGLQYLDGLRKFYASKSKDAGVVDKLLDVDTYLPKHTPTIELKSKIRKELDTAANSLEREAIYAKNDPMVKEMVENAVLQDKKFRTLDEAYATYYDYVDVVNGGKHTPIGDNKMLQKMVKDGQAKTIEEARGKIISDLKNRKQSLTPLASSLDFKRLVDLPWYDPNPARVMPQYVFDASMRVEMAKTFGAKDEVLHEMLGSLRKDLDSGVSAIENAKTFESFVRTVTGQVMHSPTEEKASALLRSLQVPKLAFAQIANLGQTLNTLLATDFGATMHGLKTAFTEKGLRDAIERGVLTNSFIRQAFEYSSGGAGAADKFLKYSGFTYTELFNRAVGSGAADMWTSANLNKLLKNPSTTSREYWALKELGLPVEDIIKRGHMLPEEKALAAQSFVEKTQFLGHPIGLPYFSSSPAGKVLFQFKTFAYQQARFITNEMKNTLSAFNKSGRQDVPRLVRNLFILSTVFPMTGEVIADIRSLITQEKRPTKAFDRYVQDIFAAGTYGMIYDFWRAAESGRTAENLLGATAGDAVRYFENLVQAPGQIMSGRGDTALKNFTKNILRQTGVGRIGVNVVYPQTKGKSSLQSLMDWSAD